jgi:Ni,Fe-hydrogenase I small subunit
MPPLVDTRPAAYPNPNQAVPAHKVIHDKPIIKIPAAPHHQGHDG